MEFPFKTTPFKHQLDCWRRSKDLKSFALFMDQGTGKSKVIIDTAAHLYLSKKIDAQVVVAPKGMYRIWTEDQIPTHMSECVKFKGAYWSSSARKKERDALADLYAEGDFLRTLVVNVEALNSEQAIEDLVRFIKRYRCLMTVDESTSIKNLQAKRTKVCINVGKHVEYRRICSGNPVPNGALDLYAQSEFLQKNLLGFQNYFAFRNRFAVVQEHRFGNRSFKNVVGYRDLDVLQKMIDKFAFVIKKDQCLDLPKKVYQVVDCEMGPKQSKAYAVMAQEAFIQLTESIQVSAPMVITQLLRLHQIACGYMQPDHGDPIPFDEPNDRISQLIALLEQCPGKAIIWATYRFNIKQIVEAIARVYGPSSVVHFYGETTPDQRVDATRMFQDPNSGVNWMVSNQSTGRFGNTWTMGTTVIYYSNDYNLESRDQSEDRSHRIGQTQSVTYIDLRCRGTVDDKIIRILKNKKKLTDEIIVGNWGWILGREM